MAMTKEDKVLLGVGAGTAVLLGLAFGTKTGRNALSEIGDAMIEAEKARAAAELERTDKGLDMEARIAKLQLEKIELKRKLARLDRFDNWDEYRKLDREIDALDELIEEVQEIIDNS